MTNHSDRLALPMLVSGQAQKEITHNEALTALDMLVQPVAISADAASPPSSPVPGGCWIIGPAASGEWTGHERKIAMWTEAGWRFAAPQNGWVFWVADRAAAMRFDEGLWRDTAEREDGLYVGPERVVGARRPAIPDPAGGTNVDSQARTAILAVLDAMRAHGLITG